VIWNRKSPIETPSGNISVKRLITKLGNHSEPVTYWLTLGHKVVYGGIDTKVGRLRYGFQVRTPDRLIFRDSPISAAAEEGCSVQTDFAQDLLEQVPQPARTRFTGLRAGIQPDPSK
jgi:hypothetical protein